MVQAILRGDKTQTRRVVKPQPEKIGGFTKFAWGAGTSENTMPVVAGFSTESKCPYGKVGDLLWVRETFLELDRDHVITERYAYKANSDADTEELRKDYVKAGRPYKWKPSIHMPKAAARIWLKVTNVRVERLHEITEEDAVKEGIDTTNGVPVGLTSHYVDYENSRNCYTSPINSFQSLWHSINGKESWDANPWAWVIEFEVVSTTGRPN